MAKHSKACSHEHLELRLHSPETGEVFDSKPMSRQEIEAAPMESHDQKLDAILTETGYIEVEKT